MSAPWLLVWLVANLALVASFAYELRPENKADRGWFGFWLGVSVCNSYSLFFKLLFSLA